ncbi:MAG: helix-turn-helix domain-containing protein [Pseudomonadota bacterium]
MTEKKTSDWVKELFEFGEKHAELSAEERLKLAVDVGLISDDQAARTMSFDNVDYLTTVEAARFTRVSLKTLEGYRLRGGGPTFTKAGPGKKSRVLYKKEHLVAWLDGQNYSSTSEY